MARTKKSNSTPSTYAATERVVVYTPDKHGRYTLSTLLLPGDTIQIDNPCRRDEKLIAKGILTLA